jgi:predicted acylesterase/phospholipase RssA
MLRQRKKENQQDTKHDTIIEIEKKDQSALLDISNQSICLYDENLSRKYYTVNFNSLVISCGGVNINKIIGITQKFYEDKKLDDIHYYEGCSAGSIVTLLLVCNYTPKEILNYILKVDYKTIFKNINLQTILSGNCILSNDILIDHISEMVKAKLGFIPTMIELYELTKKEWTAVAFNYTDYMIEYINYKTHPDVLCTHVASASSCIPILFSPVRINNKNYIDGGVYDTFPIKHHLKCHNNSNLLGIIMNDNYHSDENKQKRDTPTTKQLLHDILYITKRRKEGKQLKLNKEENICIISLDSSPGSGMNFSMDDVEKLRGYLEAYNFTKKLLTKSLKKV